MKRQFSNDKWTVTAMGWHDFLAERTIDGEYEQIQLNAHCLACAKTDVLAKYGGKVDLRGWNRQDICGSFLLATQSTIDQKTIGE